MFPHFSPLRLATRYPVPDSLSHGGGSSEVGKELETEADHKVPDVSGHLGAGDEDAPDEHHQDGVEGIADVPQPGKTDTQMRDIIIFKRRSPISGLARVRQKIAAYSTRVQLSF